VALVSLMICLFRHVRVLHRISMGWNIVMGFMTHIFQSSCMPIHMEKAISIQKGYTDLFTRFETCFRCHDDTRTNKG
jgi:hypothetical protein